MKNVVSSCVFFEVKGRSVVCFSHFLLGLHNIRQPTSRMCIQVPSSLIVTSKPTEWRMEQNLYHLPSRRSSFRQMELHLWEVDSYVCECREFSPRDSILMVNNGINKSRFVVIDMLRSKN